MGFMVSSARFSGRSATCVTYGEVMANLIGPAGQAVDKLQQYVERGSAELHYVRKIIEAGAFRLEPPQNYAAMVYRHRQVGRVRHAAVA